MAASGQNTAKHETKNPPLTSQRAHVSALSDEWDVGGKGSDRKHVYQAEESMPQRTWSSNLHRRRCLASQWQDRRLGVQLNVGEQNSLCLVGIRGDGVGELGWNLRAGVVMGCSHRQLTPASQLN